MSRPARQVANLPHRDLVPQASRPRLTRTGPCVACQRRFPARYGPQGSALCPICREVAGLAPVTPV